MLRINYVSEDKGVSQAELCRRTGISQSTMSRVMNGKARPRRRTRMLIALALRWPEDRAEELFEEVSNG